MPDTIATAEKVVLHVGCGNWRPDALAPPYQEPGWQEIRLDINPECKPDITASMTDMSAIESCSVDAVWTSHSLEHLYAHEVPLALSEFRRVLRPTGHVLVRLPNIQKVAEAILRGGLAGVVYESPIGPITPLDILYGHSASIAAGDYGMQHKTGFTATTLQAALEAAGFASVAVELDGFDIWCLAKVKAP